MSHLNKRLTVVAVLAFGVLAFGRMSRADSSNMVANAQRTLALYQKADPGIQKFIDGSAGYAVFPGVAKGAVGIGGAHGTGVLFQHQAPIGKVTLSQVSVGAQLGGQEYSEVIFFETPAALSDFKHEKTSLSAQVSAVALKSGASANAKYRDGVAIFTATKGGLMAEASVGGQKFGFEPF